MNKGEKMDKWRGEGASCEFGRSGEKGGVRPVSEEKGERGREQGSSTSTSTSRGVGREAGRGGGGGRTERRRREKKGD